MPRIVEYDAKDTKLTPLGEGETAWTGAGRRIGPAYNEAATLIREANKSVVEGGQDIAAAAGVNVRGGEAMVKAMDEQARGAENVMREAGDIAKSGENVVKAASENVAAGKAQGQAQVLQADQIEKLEKAFLSQYKDLFDIGEAGTSSKGGRGGGFSVKGGGRSSDPFGIMSNQFQNPYGAADEILNGAHALSSKLAGQSLDQYRARQFPTIGANSLVGDPNNPRFPAVTGSGGNPAYNPNTDTGGTPTMSGSYSQQNSSGLGGGGAGRYGDDNPTPGQVQGWLSEGDQTYYQGAVQQINPQAFYNPTLPNGGTNPGYVGNEASSTPINPNAPPSPTVANWASQFMQGDSGVGGDTGAGT